MAEPTPREALVMGWGVLLSLSAALVCLTVGALAHDGFLISLSVLNLLLADNFERRAKAAQIAAVGTSSTAHNKGARTDGCA